MAHQKSNKLRKTLRRQWWDVKLVRRRSRRNTAQAERTLRGLLLQIA
jgi:hypothetical protein